MNYVQKMFFYKLFQLYLFDSAFTFQLIKYRKYDIQILKGFFRRLLNFTKINCFKLLCSFNIKSRTESHIL